MRTDWSETFGWGERGFWTTTTGCGLVTIGPGVDCGDGAGTIMVTWSGQGDYSKVRQPSTHSVVQVYEKFKFTKSTSGKGLRFRNVLGMFLSTLHGQDGVVLVLLSKCVHTVFTYNVSTLRFHRLVQNVVTGLAYKILELDSGWCVTEPRLGQWD